MDAALFTDVRRSAVISECGLYRYRLTREWDGENPLACFIMLNPSTADAAEDDPTIRKCVGFARAWDCGGIVVVNLFAYRATDPKELRLRGFPMGAENLREVLGAIENEPKPAVVVCAWGAHRLPPMGNLMVDRIRMTGSDLCCLGTTKDGHPKHPLYLPYTTELVRFSL